MSSQWLVNVWPFDSFSPRLGQFLQGSDRSNDPDNGLDTSVEQQRKPVLSAFVL
jgi:hypothetical protein